MVYFAVQIIVSPHRVQSLGNVGTEVSARFRSAHYVVQNDFGITVAQSRIVMVLYTYNVGRANGFYLVYFGFDSIDA